jgi:3-oxoacyl-[acyl-carrier protein] reductase
MSMFELPVNSMNLELTNKIGFVTGASSGIGAMSARILAEEGADVVVSFGHDQAGAHDTVRNIESTGRLAWLSQMDVSDPDSVAAAVGQLKTTVSKLDLLILCAGQNFVTPWNEIAPGEWDQVIGVNLSGAFYVLQALVPLMRAGGSIVTVASVAAQTGAPHHLHYAAAKAGLVNLTKSLARDLAPHIRVNCVAPGITLTAMGQETIASLASNYAETRIPLQRYASTEEIARCIVFVASPVAGFMTGATIDINGGRDMR